MARDAPLIGFGTRVRKSPYFEATLRYGCRAFTVYNHMYMPAWFAGQVAEYWSLVEAVTLWDVAGQRQLELTGRDAGRFAELLTPRDLSACAVGRCRYVVLTADDGGIVNDPLMLRIDEDRYWFSLADSDALLWARGLAVAAGMEVRIAEPDVSPLQLQGPKAPAVIAALFGSALDDLGYFHCRRVTLDGMPLVVSRSGWSGEPGYELYLCDGRFGDRLWETVMEAGRPHAIAPAAPNQIRRIEAGMLSYGSDMGLSENPYEVNLGRLVQLDKKAPFVGREALARIHAEGPARRLVGLEIEGPPMTDYSGDHWPVLRGERRIGEVTSSVHSPRLRKNIGYGLIAAEEAAAGGEVRLAAPSGTVAARIVGLPFVARPKKA